MIGTRLMRFLSSNVAISLRGVSGAAVITERVMTSVTLCECDFTYSAARTCLPVRYSSHQDRLRSVPASARRMRSPSLTIPRSSSCSSMTGTALMRLARRIPATSSTRAFGRTLMTAETITSAAFMSHTLSGDIGGTLALRRGLRTASQGDEHLERQGVFTIVAPIVATLPSLTGRCPRQIRRTIFPALAQRAPPAQVTKQSGIRQREFIGIEVERKHKATQQVIGMAARNRAKLGVGRFRIMRQIFEIIGAQSGGFEQLIGSPRHPAPPRSREHVRQRPVPSLQ